MSDEKNDEDKIDIKSIFLILVAIGLVILFFWSVVRPAMSRSDKFATDVIEESGDGDYSYEFFNKFK